MAPLQSACAAALRSGKAMARLPHFKMSVAWLAAGMLSFLRQSCRVASLRSLQVQGAQATVEKLLRDSKIGPLDKLRLIVVFIGACPAAMPHDTLQRRATWCNPALATCCHMAGRLGRSNGPLDELRPIVRSRSSRRWALIDRCLTRLHAYLYACRNA